MIYTHFGIPFLDIKSYELDVNIVRLIPESVAREHKIIAIDKLGDILTVGITKAEDEKLLPLFEQDLQCKIIPFLITLDGWQEVIASAYIEKENNTWLG
jgi:hypothetical protein